MPNKSSRYKERVKKNSRDNLKDSVGLYSEGLSGGEVNLTDDTTLVDTHSVQVGKFVISKR